MILSLTAVFLNLTLSAGHGATAQGAINVSMTNSPGFFCQKIEVAMVYSQPSISSHVLGRTQDFIAVTGKDVNGFYPIITGMKIRGWVMVNQTFQGKSFEARPCRVQVQPNGQLLFEQP